MRLSQDLSIVRRWKLANAFDPSSLIIPEGINQDYIGDSITTGQEATVQANEYTRLIDAHIAGGGTITERAAGGSGVLRAALVANQNYTERTTGLISLMAGFNDIHRAYDSTTSAITISTYAPKTTKKIQGATRIVLMNALAKTFHGNSTFTEASGTWTGAALTGAKNTTKFVSGGAAGELTKTISGDVIGFAFIGSDGTTTYGDVTITIDSVEVASFSLNNTYDGISDGTYNNQVGPYGVIVGGLGSGSHSVSLTFDNGVCPFDYAVELGASTDYLNPCIVFNGIKSTSTGYNNNMSFTDVTHGDNVMNYLSTLVEGVVNEFRAYSYPVIYVDVARTVNSTQNMSDSSDGSHPNDLGHAAIAAQAISQLTLNEGIFNNFKDCGYSIENDFYIGRNSAAWQAYGAGDYYLPAGVDGYAEYSVPNNDNTEFGMIGLNTTKALETYTGYEYAVGYSAGDIRRLTSGGSYTGLGNGQAAIGSKIRIEVNRAASEAYIKYASDGVNFSTLYTWTSVPDSNYYLNIAFAGAQLRCYGLILNGFVK